MNIIVMEKIGFCYGVDRSISITKQVKDLYPKPWILLGPLVHNDIVNQELLDNGFEMLKNKNEIENFQNVTFISTAHGINPNLIEQIKKNNNTLIETTCPIVLKNNNKIIDYAKKGYDVIYIGKHNHQESDGIIDYIKLVENVEDINNLDLNNNLVVLTNQTTMSIKDINDCTEALLNKYPNALIDTIICPATKERQVALLKHLDEYHGEFDKWLIIGDKLSNNTRKLSELTKNYTNNYHFVENINDVKVIDFSNTINLLVTSGTSTPNSVINEIVEYITKNIQ